MARLKFEMWKDDPKYGGYMSRFTDGTGKWTDSWWSSPPPSIDHVGREYIPGRHPNVRTIRHDQYIKNRFKEEMSRLAAGEEQQ